MEFEQVSRFREGMPGGGGMLRGVGRWEGSGFMDRQRRGGVGGNGGRRKKIARVLGWGYGFVVVYWFSYRKGIVILLCGDIRRRLSLT